MASSIGVASGGVESPLAFVGFAAAVIGTIGFYGLTGRRPHKAAIHPVAATRFAGAPAILAGLARDRPQGASSRRAAPTRPRDHGACRGPGLCGFPKGHRAAWPPRAPRCRRCRRWLRQPAAHPRTRSGVREARHLPDPRHQPRSREAGARGRDAALRPDDEEPAHRRGCRDGGPTELGVRLVQGYRFGRPAPLPPRSM